MNYLRKMPKIAMLSLCTSLYTAAIAQADELAISVSKTFQHLDLHNSNSNVDVSGMEGVLQRLIAFDQQMKLKPMLATNWVASDDAKTFTLHLRKGVKFHDGSDFNAAAVKANLDRLADQSQNLKKNSLFKMVDTVEVVDENTVVLKLKSPFGAMINSLAHPSVVMHSPASLKRTKAEIDKEPVGTGPFKFKEWIPGEKLVVEKFDGYWEKDWPKVDKVTFYPVTENATSASMLLSDEIQFIHILPPEIANKVNESEGYEVLEIPGITVSTASMNMQQEHFKDARVREAFNLAINQEAYIGIVHAGHGKVPDAPIAPNTAFHAPQHPPLGNDVERARELMAEAGYGDGLEITIWGRNNSSAVRTLQFLQQQLSQINVKANIVPMEGATRNEKVYSDTVAQDKEYDMLLGNWSPPTGDADWHLRPVYSTEGWLPKIYNMAFYSNETVDNAIQDALETADPEKRREAYKIAMKQIWEDKPVVWLGVENKMSGRKQGLTGVHQQPDGSIQYSYASYE